MKGRILSVSVIQGDCLEVIPTLTELFDAVVTDPPYHLTSIVKRFGADNAAPAKEGTDGAFSRASRGFMGKRWDGGDIAFSPEVWRLVYAAMKPGAHLVAFGGSRGYHRMACAIEDAGFEIRDSLMWLYGTGFPKSHDVSKGIDKHFGATRTDVVGTKLGRPGMAKDGSNQRSGFDDAFGGDASGIMSTDITAPATPEAAQWQGWGTALKPAFEPIVLARKPLGEKTVAANVLRHGVGGINIDACRIETGDGANRARPPRTPNEILGGGSGTNLTASPHNDLGRFPANVLHDGSDEVLAAFAAYGERGVNGGSGEFVQHAWMGGNAVQDIQRDKGSAARFFYSAKASKADRADSKHPTVKPLALMRWLCKLVTPPGGRILDPFAGSGTTLQAAHECGFSAVGVEREDEYVADILRRIETATQDKLADAPRKSAPSFKSDDRQVDLLEYIMTHAA